MLRFRPRLTALFIVAGWFELPALAVGAEAERLRLFAGGVHYRWRTQGDHGHLRECRTSACDEEDWRRANLDNSMGLRLGAERLWRPNRLLTLSAGGEADLFSTEYNLSQRDLQVGAVFATTGVGVGGGWGALVAQVGVGGFATSDGRGGLAGFAEAGVEAALASSTRLRLAARRTRLDSLAAEEVSLSLRATPGGGGLAPWRVGLAVGGHRPARGRDAGLSRGALWQVHAGRNGGEGKWQLGLLLGASVRESREGSVWGGVAGNQRGREVWEAGAWWDCRALGGPAWEVRLGAAARAADWRDEGPLLRTSVGERRAGGVEGGVGASFAAGWRVGDGVVVQAVVEPVLWPRLELLEYRIRLGIGTSAGGMAGSHAGEGASCPTLVCGWARDGGALLARPARWGRRDWRAFGLAGLAVGAVAAVDEPIRDGVQRRSTASSREAAERFRPVSFWGPVVGSSAVWAAARWAGREGLAEAAADTLESVLLTVLVVVPVMKEVSGRARPAAGLGAGHLRPFSEYKSFPSGEVAQAFAVATVARQHGAPGWLSGALWVFAGAVTWSRLELDRHWASDAVAGALVGAAVGKWVVGRATARRGKHEVVVNPVALAGGGAIVTCVRW